MTFNKIHSILEAHSIASKEDAGRLYADEVYYLDGVSDHEWLDVTHYTHEELYRWLGY